MFVYWTKYPAEVSTIKNQSFDVFSQQTCSFVLSYQASEDALSAASHRERPQCVSHTVRKLLAFVWDRYCSWPAAQWSAVNYSVAAVHFGCKMHQRQWWLSVRNVMLQVFVIRVPFALLFSLIQIHYSAFYFDRIDHSFGTALINSHPIISTSQHLYSGLFEVKVRWVGTKWTTVFVISVVFTLHLCYICICCSIDHSLTLQTNFFHNICCEKCQLFSLMAIFVVNWTIH